MTDHGEPYPGQNPSPEPAGVPSGLPVHFDWHCPERTELPTSEGTTLEISPGRVPVSLLLSFPEAYERDPELDYPQLRCELTADGRRWRSQTFVSAERLAGPVSSRRTAAESGLRFWSDVPAEWASALRDRCLLAGVHALLDSRDRFRLPVGGTEITMMLKYQGAVLDLAWLEAERRMVVRARDMYYEIGEGDGPVQTVDQVCFGALVDPSYVLPFIQPWGHWRRWQGWFGDDEEGTVLEPCV